MRAHEAEQQFRIALLERFRYLHVGVERWRARMQHGKLIVVRERQDFCERQSPRRCVDQAAVRDQRGRLRQPGRIPERSDLALGLVAGSGATVETLERRRIQK